MNRSIPQWQTAGFLFTSVTGTLLHFLFDWTGGNVLAAVFSAVNESIWEHMKLLFCPMLLFALVEYRVWGKEHSEFWYVKTVEMAEITTNKTGSAGWEAHLSLPLWVKQSALKTLRRFETAPAYAPSRK